MQPAPSVVAWSKRPAPQPPLRLPEEAADASTKEEYILESIGEQEEENPEPRLDERRFLISDELGAIFGHVESRWDEMCSQVRGGLSSRTLAHRD